ncbi:MAG: rhodanese-like domain-containing protein [Pseudomonadota bacterium]
MCFKQFLLSAVLATLLSSILLSSTVFAAVGQITDQQLKQMMQDGVSLIDIRRAEEWKQTGVVKGSHLLTFFDKKGNYNIDKWLSDFSKIVKKGEPFILICRTGNRTGMVSKFLDYKLGYKNVNHLSRGIKSWIKASNKVVKP